MKIVISSMSVQYFQNYIRSFFFAKYLVKLGHQVTLLTASPRKKWYKFSLHKIENVKVIVIPDVVNWRLRRGALGPFNLFFRLIYLLTHRFDIYHGDGHRPAVVFPIIIARSIYKKPFISEWMDLFGVEGISKDRNKIERKFIAPYDNYFECKVRKMAEAVVVLSKGLQNRVITIDYQKPTIILHGGCDIDNIKNLPIHGCRQLFGLPPNKFIVGIVGINDNEDFQDTLIFIKALKELNVEMNDKFLLITSGGSSQIERTIQEYGKNNFIKNMGWLRSDQYNSFLCAADMLIMPLIDNERNKNKWPMKFGDFLAAGRAVISNPVGDIYEYFEMKNIGYLIENNDESIKTVLRKCFSNPDEIKKMGENARELAQSYSWEVKTKSLINFYKKILES